MVLDRRYHTHLPPKSSLVEQAAAVRELEELKVLGPDGEELTFPPEVLEAFRDVVSTMSCGNGVYADPLPQNMWVTDAANYLGISCDALFDLLRDGEIPYTTTNGGKEIQFQDVLKYAERKAEEWIAGCERITELSHEYGLYDKYSIPASN